MDELYEKVQDKNDERRNSISSKKSFKDDEKKIENTIRSSNKNKTVSLLTSGLKITDFLNDEFDDKRYKGKQFNCGRVSEKEKKKDILDDTEFGKKLKKKLAQAAKDNKKAIERDLLIKKSIEEKDKNLSRFICGKYQDPNPYPKSNIFDKKSLRSQSADLKSSSRVSLEIKKETLKPFICGKPKSQDKIEHFSPLTLTSRDIEKSLAESDSKIKLTSRMLSTISLEKPISDKPIKVGKYVDPKEKLLYSDVEFNKKNIKELRASRDLEEYIKKQEIIKSRPTTPMKFGKIDPPKQIPYFSSEKRKTLSEYLKEVNRSKSANSTKNKI